MVQGIVERRRRNIEVVATHTIDGRVLPSAVHWYDGRSFAIDEIVDVQRRASLKVGGCGLRYLVRIGRSRTYLFYEDPLWFVEEIVIG
jgi:hypothetical protein